MAARGADAAAWAAEREALRGALEAATVSGGASQSALYQLAASRAEAAAANQHLEANRAVLAVAAAAAAAPIRGGSGGSGGGRAGGGGAADNGGGPLAVELASALRAVQGRMTLLLAREARLQREVVASAAAEERLKEELLAATSPVAEAASFATRTLAYIDEAKALRLAVEDGEARLTAKSCALAEAQADAAAMRAARDAAAEAMRALTQQVLDRGEVCGSATSYFLSFLFYFRNVLF